MPKEEPTTARPGGTNLQFITSNFIGAGGNDGQNPLRQAGTHASRLLAVIQFNRFTSKLRGAPLSWIGAAGVPNVVFSGAFTSTVSPLLGTHHRVSHSSKFPGYAVHTGGEGPMKATPEVFLSGKFIVPGMKTPYMTAQTIKELKEIVTPFLEPK